MKAGYNSLPIEKILWFGALLLALVALPGAVSAADNYFDSNGVKIRYVTEGEGEAVVLLHGWMSDSTMWGRDEAGQPKLDTEGSEGFQLIAFDLRGHGKSDKPTDPEKYGIEMAKDVVRLLDHLKIRKAHLIGYSAGAFIAGKVVAMYPKRVLSVVYGGQAPVLEGYKESDFSENDAFARVVNAGKELGEYIIETTPAGRPKPSAEQASAIARYMFGGKDVKGFALSGSSFKKLAVSVKQLRKSKAPVLFIYGGNESNHVKGRVKTVHDALGYGEVKIIEGATHISTIINPEFGRSITDFVQRVKEGKAKQ